MRIVTDNGVDITPEQLEGLEIDIVPLVITLGDDHYRGGVDIQSDEFYKMLRDSEHFPTTSQPSPAEFREKYLEIAETDPNIISIHMSSKLSGTFNSARIAANEVQHDTNANITVIDSKHISGSLGWMVEAAARAAKDGWSRGKIVELVKKIGEASVISFSPDTMKYLVNGGRVGHLRGLAASMLNIKPILSVKYESGAIESVSTVRTMKKALSKQVDLMAEVYGEGAALRGQVIHADNPEMAAYLAEQIHNRFDCTFSPQTTVTPLVGAHTGPGLVGAIHAPMDAFADVPQ